MILWGIPHGIMGKGTLSGDTACQTRYVSYVTSAGVETNDPQIRIRLFNDSGGATVAGGVYRVTFDGDEEENPKVVACSAQTVDCYAVVSPEAYADQTWGWYVIAGYVDALVDGDSTDVTKDDFLKIVTATNADAFLDDTTSRTAKSYAIACADNTSTEALTKVFLFGEKADMD